MSDVMLKIENITKDFGITRALDDVSFEINAGEIHALIGENGSGKSTLTNLLCGIYSGYTGKFILDGNEIKPKNLIEANKLGISIIVQEQGTLSDLTVAETIFLGHEDRFVKFGIRNIVKMNREANNLLKKYDINNIKAQDLIDNYSFEDQKLVELVRATYFNPKILIVDETTTALSEDGRNALYKQMELLKNAGSTIIFISHDLQEILDKTDRISVLRDGIYIKTLKTEGVWQDDLKKLMVGREMSGSYYRSDYGEKISREVVLKVRDVSVPGFIRNVNFELHKGEILGIGGLSESGMHEIGKAIFGASFGRSGIVELADGTIINSVFKAIEHNVAYMSKDRDNESIILYQSISENIALPSLKKLGKGFLNICSEKDIEKFSDKYAKQISVKMTDVGQFVSELSGGNKQKVVLARWLAYDFDVIILDSPTRGIDIGVKQDIYHLMDELRKRGKSIIMISEELMELIGMCDRIIIMKNGYESAVLDRDKNLDENVLIGHMV